jgi:hypothetical protein
MVLLCLQRKGAANLFSFTRMHGTLSFRMDTTVRTGTTKPQHDLVLVSLSLETLHNERVCLLAEITAPEKEAHAIERECEEIVRHALLESEGEASERLDSTLKELNGLLKGVLVSGVVQDAHLLIGIIDRSGTLHVSHAGRAEAYLIRRGSCSQITEYTAGKPTPAFVHIASGMMEDGDLVVLSTQRLLRTFTPAQLARLTLDRDGLIDQIGRALEAEQEHAALACIIVQSTGEEEEVVERPTVRAARTAQNDRRSRMQQDSLLSRLRLPAVGNLRLPSMSGVSAGVASVIGLLRPSGSRAPRKAKAKTGPGIGERLGAWWAKGKELWSGFVADLSHPQRKKRAHLLLLAGALGVLVLVWAVVHLVTSSQRSKTTAELETIVEEIGQEIQLAENRAITGDTDGANANLRHARERAIQLRDNDTGQFRGEANTLLERIRVKEDELNNVVRLTPRSIPLTGSNPDILARGIIGLGNSEFVVFDKQSAYRVLLKSVEPGARLSEDLLVVDGVNFDRFQSQAFLMSGNSVVEFTGGQPITMKTDDPRGWMSGVAIDAYLRYLYVLSPENNQIYKYERLGNRYSAPVEYNVNGPLTGALDMAIDGSVYVLKDDGSSRTILKLFRGETQNYVIRGIPDDALKTVSKLFKVADRNLYLLDPVNRRVMVVSDGGATGEATYVRQFVLEASEGNDDELQDLYVDPDEAQMFILADKHIYVIDLTAAR